MLGKKRQKEVEERKVNKLTPKKVHGRRKLQMCASARKGDKRRGKVTGGEEGKRRSEVEILTKEPFCTLPLAKGHRMGKLGHSFGLENEKVKKITQKSARLSIG